MLDGSSGQLWEGAGLTEPEEVVFDVEWFPQGKAHLGASFWKIAGMESGGGG